MSSRSKGLIAAVGVLALGGIVFLLLRPAAPETTAPPLPPPVVKPPMVRAPPPEPPRVAMNAPPDAVMSPDAAVAEAPVAAAASTAPDPLQTPKIFHHPPPPRSMGARFLAVERRYDKARSAWTVARSHKNPAEQLKYDALLQKIGNDLSSGARQNGAAELQDFVTNALDGVEP